MLAVIGTAGRLSDADRISLPLYDAMYSEMLGTMTEWNIRSLVSGGATVADHLAVRAFLEGEAEHLVLHLPAPFQGGRYVQSGSAIGRDASTANRYHHQFSDRCGINSLQEIEAAIARGASSHVGRGFKARNLDVAEAATHLLAFTFGNGQEDGGDTLWRDFAPDEPGFQSSEEAGLRDGGTAHTWGQCWKADLKRHVNLNVLDKRLRTIAQPGPGTLMRL